MEPVICRIVQDPLAYLPEISLVSFRSYLRGYFIRLGTCGVNHPEFKMLSEFNDWIIEKYGAWRAGHDAASILQSYSASEEDAYRKFIQEFDEFSRNRPPATSDGQEAGADQSGRSFQTFEELLADMRKRPPIYVPVASFRSAAVYLLGHLRAGRDLKLQADDGEVEFLKFQKWVERTRNKGLARSWYQLVLFHSATDCDHNDRGAFNVFYAWHDEFLKAQKEPG